jgi:hypothetical protein
MELTEKQTAAIDFLEDDITNELVFGGGAGGGKSAIGCYWILKNAFKYPGSRWAIGRSRLTVLKETTYKTFLEVLKIQGIKKDLHIKLIEKPLSAITANGSEIIFKDLFYYPSDPDVDSLGSLEITGAFVDEAAEIKQIVKDVLQSRIRYKLDEFGLIPKILYTCNPTKGWIKKDFYEPARAGSLPEHRKFVQSLVKDNPNISKHYIANLLKLPKALKERLYFGNWDYDDNPALLMDYAKILDLHTNQHTVGNGRYITADIAGQGDDKYIICVWEGFKVINYAVKDRESNVESEVYKFLEEKIKDIAKRYRVPMSNIAFDADGLGNYLSSYLPGAQAIHNNARPKLERGKNTQYQNLKSQLYFILAAMVNEGIINASVLKPVDFELLAEELNTIENETFGREGKLKVIDKKTIKEKIGRSPDWADCIAYRMIFTLINVKGVRKLN